MMRKRPPTDTSVEVEALIQMTLPPPDQIQKDQTRLVASKRNGSDVVEAKSIVVPEPKKKKKLIKETRRQLRMM
ncbi:unnamed protein product [Prunus armeniaca]|uniref:Uncharacterized protein n=1 Tax=Prunus armeniaca TaxID=36596 RepID=A0A6J5V703_PRUAR|nr:unnamed protein product [Prunus armeniaca]